MKRIFIYCALPLLTAACGRSGDFDATGTFEATEVVVSAEAAGRILRFDAEEGDVLEAGRQVGAIDTVQLYLQKLQLERQRASVVSNRPDIAKQAASLREQIAKQQTERRRVENLLRDGAATTKQLDDIDAQIKVLNGQLEAQLSTLRNNAASIDENSSSIDLQIARIEDQLAGLKLGQEVTVTADFGGDSRIDYPGRIVWIASESEFTPKTIQTRDSRANLVYAAKIAVENDGRLKIGLYGEVRLRN